MYLTFETGIGSVTGANFLVETKEKKFLVDCGMIQGDHETEKQNRIPFSYTPADIDYLFVTHAHLDHVGRIGKLVKDGFHGVIYSTPETFALAQLVMTDAVGILGLEAKKENIQPLYESQHTEKAFTLWKTIPYHVKTDIGDFSLYLKDAGHILGSSIIEFTIEGKKVVFTGDLGNSPTPLLRDTESIEGAEYMIMESVYGDRNHEPKDERDAKFEKIVTETIAKGGTLVIPSFSLERTQVILYELNNIAEKGKLNVPVYVDSPLATKVTDIYRESTELFNEGIKKQIASGDDIFDFKKLKFTINHEESNALDRMQGPKIILAGSGMSMGGRVRHHEASYLPNPNNTILLVGYQPLGTLGRNLQDAKNSVTIDKQKIKVEAKIETIFGYSSHKDSDHLVEFVFHGKATLKKVFPVMGEPKSSLFLAQRIKDELGIDAMYPEKGKRYEL